jgi:multiple sugar transport system substrate-binding protein
MARITLRGITWGHRRAIDPLLATLADFSRMHPEIAVDWSSRSLHGFEFAPVEELARNYDLIVLDHPFAGEIAGSRCLRPLDELLDATSAGAFVGRSLETYRYGGSLWAMPVDAACQVAVARPDLLASLDRPAPRDWAEMTALGRRARDRGWWLAIGLKGVHALMTFFTLCANLGRPCTEAGAEPFVDPATGRAALDAMRSLLQFCPPESLNWNSIELHEAMVARDDLVFCPAVYCYATYAEADMRRPLRFSDLPGLARQVPSGSTIGGTGIGLSALCAEPAAALAYIRYLATPVTQKAFAAHHGQPAHVDAWNDREIDARFGGCFAATRATMEGAWVRPRYPGYLKFQAAGGELVERHLRGALTSDELLSRLADLQRVCAPAGVDPA